MTEPVPPLKWAALLLLGVLAPMTSAQESRAPAEVDAQQAIGWKLFFDPNLSRNRNTSCASCHDPGHGYSDGKRFSLGTHGEELTRNSPTVVNLANANHLFWDGRADSLETQAEGPLTDPREMDMSLAEVVDRVSADSDYLRAFQAIGVDQISISDITTALAAFQRNLVTGETAYDRWLQGDRDALDRSQSNGRFLFFTRGQCATCHIGDNFSDNSFHNIGTGTEQDLGRFMVTGEERDRGAFKTPSLRNWRGTEPFMHDGRFASMEDVIDFYMETPASQVGRSELDPLNFRERDRNDLLAFMDALNGDWPDLSPHQAVWQALVDETASE